MAGNFLGYQFVTDLNYSEICSFSEMEFVIPGPGALDGIHKCFTGLGGLNEVEIIRLGCVHTMGLQAILDVWRLQRNSDTETGFLRLGLAQPIAEAMGSPCIQLEELHFNALANTVSMQLSSFGEASLTPDEIQDLLQRINLTWGY